MFNSYVSLPEGIPLDQSSVDQEGFSVDTSSRIILPAPDQCKQSTGTVESVEFTIKFPPPMNSLFNIYIYILTYIHVIITLKYCLRNKWAGCWGKIMRNPCSLRTVELAYFLREGFTMIHSAKNGNPLLEALLIWNETIQRSSLGCNMQGSHNFKDSVRLCSGQWTPALRLATYCPGTTSRSAVGFHVCSPGHNRIFRIQLELQTCL